MDYSFWNYLLELEKIKVQIRNKLWRQQTERADEIKLQVLSVDHFIESLHLSTQSSILKKLLTFLPNRGRSSRKEEEKGLLRHVNSCRA